MKRIILAAGLVCLATFATPVAAEPLDGVVTGQVINGTSGGTAPAGDIVTLHIFNMTAESAEKVGERTAPVGPDGRFEFAGLDRAANVAYYVGTSHGGVSYSHPSPFQLKDAPTRQADISVFEATTSDDVIQFDRLNFLVLEVEPDMLQVLQMGALVNSSDRTFVTENPQDGALARAVRFPLPKGAMRAQFQSGFRQDDVIAGAGGIQVVSPLKPGRHEYALWFQLPYNESSVDLTLQAPYPTAAFTIHVPEGGPKIESSQLTAQEPRQLGDRTFLVHSARDVSKATMISARLGGLPSSGSAGLSTEQLAMVSGGVVLLVLGAGVFAFSLRARGSRSKASGGAAAEKMDLEQERLQLVVRLAALDERYAAGQIPETEYQAERTRDKQRLVELLRAARP
jgi:hypothetical protein